MYAFKNELIFKAAIIILSFGNTEYFSDLQNTPEFKKLSSALTQIVRTGSDELAFKAAVSLGRLCVVAPVAKIYLIRRLPEFNSQQKEEVSGVQIRFAENPLE